MDFNREWKQCPNGHWYDPNRVSMCPQCAERSRSRASALTSARRCDPVEPDGRNEDRTEYIGKNTPLKGTDETELLVSSGKAASDRSVGVSRVGIAGSGSVESTNKPSAGGEADDHGPVLQPVVGWLVCISGPERGRDYRIREGYNSVGRSSSMDICIAGDRAVSREKHATIAYDPAGNRFFFAPAEGKSILKINDIPVLMPTALQSYDILTIGSSKLLFVPLCGERFAWKDE